MTDTNIPAGTVPETDPVVAPATETVATPEVVVAPEAAPAETPAA